MERYILIKHKAQGAGRPEETKGTAMYDYTTAGPVSTTRYPLAEGLIVCLLGFLVLLVGC